MPLTNPIYNPSILFEAEARPSDSSVDGFNANNLIAQGSYNKLKNCRRSSIINGSGNLTENIVANNKIGNLSAFNVIEYKNDRLTDSVFLIDYQNFAYYNGSMKLVYRTAIGEYLTQELSDNYIINLGFIGSEDIAFEFIEYSGNYFIKLKFNSQYVSPVLDILNSINNFIDEYFEYSVQGSLLYRKYLASEAVVNKESESEAIEFVNYLNSICRANLVTLNSDFLMFYNDEYDYVNYKSEFDQANQEKNKFNRYYTKYISNNISSDSFVDVFNMWNKSNQLHILCQNGIEIISGVEYFDDEKIYSEAVEVVYTYSQPLGLGSLENSSNKIRVNYDPSNYLEENELIFIAKSGESFDPSDLNSYLEYRVAGFGSDNNGYYIEIYEVYQGVSISEQNLFFSIIHGKYKRTSFFPGTKYSPSPFSPGDGGPWEIIELNIDIKKYLAISNSIETRTDSNIYSSRDVISSSLSDKRLKNNVLTLKESLCKIINIDPVQFKWNNLQETFVGNDVGLIAQQVEKVIPEVVTIRKSGVKAINYKKICTILIGCIKEKQERINNLKNKIKQINEQ